MAETKSSDEGDKQYVGIVDTNGLDSFKEFTPTAAHNLKLRAELNPHRHACFFIVTFPESVNPQVFIAEAKDTWDMWSFILVAHKDLRCDPKDVNTILNIEELAEVERKLTGKGEGLCKSSV